MITNRPPVAGQGRPEAADIPFVKGLHELGDGTWAYLQPRGELGYSNAGLVAGVGSSLLVDTLFDLRMTAELLGSAAAITAEHPLRLAVNTHANGDHTFGNALLPPGTEVWGSVATAEEFADYPPAAMLASQRADPHGRLDAFNFEDIELRHPDRTFSASTTVDVGGRLVELHEVGPAHTRGDVVVHVPDAGVVFAGDVLFIGIAPMMWVGPVGNCIAAIDRICAFAPRLIVPGHGPVTDVAGARVARDVLTRVAEVGARRAGDGMTPLDALVESGPAPFAGLLEPERVLSIADLVWAELTPDYQRLSGAGLHAAMEQLASLWESR